MDIWINDPYKYRESYFKEFVFNLLVTIAMKIIYVIFVVTLGCIISSGRAEPREHDCNKKVEDGGKVDILTSSEYSKDFQSWTKGLINIETDIRSLNVAASTDGTNTEVKYDGEINRDTGKLNAVAEEQRPIGPSFKKLKLKNHNDVDSEEVDCDDEKDRAYYFHGSIFKVRQIAKTMPKRYLHHVTWYW